MFDNCMNRVYKEFSDKNAKEQLGKKNKPVVETLHKINPKMKKFNMGTELFQSLQMGEEIP